MLCGECNERALVRPCALTLRVSARMRVKGDAAVKVYHIARNRRVRVCESLDSCLSIFSGIMAP